MRLSESLNKQKLLVLAIGFSLALCLIYSLLSLVSYFGLSFFVLTNRGMVEHNGIVSLFSSSLDRYVWEGAVLVILVGLFYGLGSRRLKGIYGILADFVSCSLVVLVGLVIFGFIDVFAMVLGSILVAVLCFLVSFVFFGVSRFYMFKSLLVGTLFLVLFEELAALILFNVPAFLNLNPQLSGPALHWSSVELVFSNMGYPFIPYAYLMLVLLGVAAFVVMVLPGKWLFNKIRGGWLVGFEARLRGLFDLNREIGTSFLRGRLAVPLAVVVSSVVSCLFVVFTVLPWVNPTNMLVSVDSPAYFQWLEHMRSVDVNSALSFALGNDRALFLVLIYGLSFFVSSLSVIQYVSALLLVLFGVVCFFVLRLLCKFRAVWVIGVLLVPFSFQGLGLIYSGYFANMLALILVFAYVILFFRLLDKWSSLGFLGLLSVSVLVLFSHSWTWFIFALSLVAFLFLEWRLAVGKGRLFDRVKGEAILVVATIGVGLICDLIRRFLSSAGSSSSVFVTAQSSLGFPDVGFLLSGLQNSVDFVLGGVFANGLLIVLSVVGFLVLVKFKSGVSNFLVAWIFVGCVSILFAAKSFVFDRFLFLMPWVVLSSLGLFFVICFVGGWKSWRRWIVFLVLAVIFLVLLNWGLRFLFNVNIW